MSHLHWAGVSATRESGGIFPSLINPIFIMHVVWRRQFTIYILHTAYLWIMNYFELFGLKESPVADSAAASKKYIELQKKFHPDFYMNENEAEKENALEQSAHVNKAYNIFRNADKTLEYFLQHKGLITANEKYNLPPDFLMEMMEMNEAFDDTGTEDIGKNIAAFEEKLYESVKPLLSETASLNDDSFQQLKEYFYKKKYLKRILERLAD